MLDLTSAYSELYQVKLFDGTILDLNRPTQALQRRIMELQKLGSKVENTGVIMDETLDIFTKVLNRNTAGITFTREELEEEYDYSVALLVIGDYLKYYAEEVTNRINFRNVQ